MEDDLQLINNIKNNNDEDSLKELIHRHSGIYIDMVNKHIPESLEGVDKEDIMEDKDFCIYDAAINFDESKNAKFSTYVGNLARWKCLNIYNKKIKFPQESINSTSVLHSNSSKSSGSNLFTAPSTNFMEDMETLGKIYECIENAQDPRVKKIFTMRYSSGRTLTPWRKIAKKLDISIQGAINIHNKQISELKKQI